MNRLAATLILVASAGVVVSGDLTAYQVGTTDNVWDPLFGTGSEEVLTSSFSQMFPVPDASLGLLAYGVDIVLTLLIVAGIGGFTTRLALLVVAGCGALASLGLIFAQAFIVHAFCTLCLVSAGLSFVLAAGALIVVWRGFLESRNAEEAEAT